MCVTMTMRIAIFQINYFRPKNNPEPPVPLPLWLCAPLGVYLEARALCPLTCPGERCAVSGG